jgi:hypothetical protein
MGSVSQGKWIWKNRRIDKENDGYILIHLIV